MTSTNTNSSFRLNLAKENHKTISFLPSHTKAALKAQDESVAKAATERYEAYKIYERKRENHILAKKDRTAINKNVKLSEKVLVASKKKILALNRLSSVASGREKATKFEADVLQAEQDINRFMMEVDGSAAGTCDNDDEGYSELFVPPGGPPGYTGFGSA